MPLCKATIVNDDQWSRIQHGREITVYIFRHVDQYTDGDWMGSELPSSAEDIGQEASEVEVRRRCGPPLLSRPAQNYSKSINLCFFELQQEFYLGVEYERSWESFWVFFIKEVENR